MEVGLYIFNNKDRALTESMRFFANSNLTIPAKLVVPPLGSLKKRPHKKCTHKSYSVTNKL